MKNINWKECAAVVGISIGLLFSNSLHAEEKKYLSFEEVPCQKESGGECSSLYDFAYNVLWQNLSVASKRITKRAKAKKTVLVIDEAGVERIFEKPLKSLGAQGQKRLSKDVRDEIKNCLGELDNNSFSEPQKIFADFDENLIKLDAAQEKISNLILELKSYQTIHSKNENDVCYTFTYEKMGISTVNQNGSSSVFFKGGAVQYLIDSLKKEGEKRLK